MPQTIQDIISDLVARQGQLAGRVVPLPNPVPGVPVQGRQLPLPASFLGPEQANLSVLPQAQAQLPPLPPPQETPVNLPWSPGAYGTETPGRSYQDILNELVKNITARQKASPVKVPFPAGTQTLSKQQLEEQKRQFEKEYALQQKQLALSAARAASGGGGTKQPTLTERTRAAKAEAYAAIDDAIAKGLTADEINASIDSQKYDLMMEGVDPEELKGYVDKQVTGGKIYQSPQAKAQAEEKAQLGTRPWWQKLIDVVVPGAQYR